MRNGKWTTGFPTSYSWSAYVTPKSPKGWLEKRFYCKVFCVKTSSGKVVTIFLYLTVYRYWRET